MGKLTDLFQRVLLLQQYSDKRDFNPADQLTLSFEEINEHTNTINQALITIFHRVKSPTDQPTGQRQISAVQETNDSATATLNATNLHQYQLDMQNARQATFQKNNTSNRAPAAPTSPQPPFTFGAQSPQGLAKYPDKPNGLTQDKLSLPSTKRRKGNQVTATTATPAPGIPKSAQANKITILDAQPAALASRIKCPLPNCQSSLKEFGTQIELDAHASEVHGPKEPPIEDPLQWTLQQARLGVGLDETGKSMPRPEQEVLGTPKIKASESEPAQHLNKQESSTLMARAQTGRSPVFHLKTPQASVGIKTPSPEAKSSDMDGKITEPHTSEKTFQKSLTSSPDPWATSHIPPAVINNSWPDLPDVSFIGPWTTIQNALTPTSTQSSGKSEKNSPRISDISEHDAVKINLFVDDSEWANMFEDQIYGDVEALNEDKDQLGMDWESAFGLEELAGSGEIGIAAGVNDLTIDNNDWMKIYAPQSMDQSKG